MELADKGLDDDNETSQAVCFRDTLETGHLRKKTNVAQLSPVRNSGLPRVQ